MSSELKFFHSSKDCDEIKYIYDKRNQDKLRSLGVKMRREGPEILVFSGESQESLQKGFEEVEQIRARYFKPIVKRVYVTKDQVGYFRGKESKHSKQVEEMTHVDKVNFWNIKDRNGVEMVRIEVRGSRPSVDKFMTEVLRSVSNLTQRQLEFEAPSEEEIRESRAAARAARSVREETAGADPDEEVEPVPKDTWKKVKHKKKPKLPPPGEDPDEEEEDDDEEE